MNRFCYNVYYKYGVKNRLDHMHNELSDEEQKQNISRLPIELDGLLGDNSFTASIENGNILCVQSDREQAEIDDCVKQVLGGLALFGDPV